MGNSTQSFFKLQKLEGYEIQRTKPAIVKNKRELKYVFESVMLIKVTQEGLRVRCKEHYGWSEVRLLSWEYIDDNWKVVEKDDRTKKLEALSKAI